MAECKTCGAAITWCVTESGKRMPLDAKPEKRIVLGQSGKARVVDTYVSHFSTCPQAGEHRRTEKTTPSDDEPPECIR